MPLAASAITVRRRFLAARDVRVMRFHTPGGVDHDQKTHGGDGGSVDVYHGTADTLVASILKEGIVPGKERSGDKWAAENGWTSIIASHEGRALSVYVSTHDDGAKSFSEYAAQVRPGAVPVLLKLSVPRSVYDSFKQDEQGGSTLKRFEGALKPEYIVGYKIPVRGKWSGEYTPVSNREWMEEHKQLYLLIFASATAKFSRPTPSRAASRVNFAAIKQREDALARTAVPEAANAVARGVRRMLGDDEQLASLLDDDPQDIAALAMNGVDVGRVRAAFDGALETAYETGRVTGANELTRAGRPESFAALREKAAGYIAANGFRMAENVSEATRAVIQGELLTGVKSGKRPSEVRTAIWNGLVAKGLTSREAALGVETDEAVTGALNELWVDDEEQAAHYLDTLVRTNSFEAMNEARYAEFTDPAVAGFVQALEYSAILDANTTEICQHLDGRVYRADNEAVWDKWRPPNHYNALSEGTLITTARGAVPIESVVAGELVLTHRGWYRPVYTVMRKPPDRPTLLAIHLDSGHVLRATDEHPVLTSGGWKRADELQLGDVLFERSQQVRWVRDVLLPDPENFPSLFNEPTIPYEITSSICTRVMAAAVQLKPNAVSRESEVEDVSTDDELMLEGVVAKQREHHSHAGGGVAPQRRGLSSEDFVTVRVPRVTGTHAGSAVGAGLAERPMTFSGTLGDDFGQSVGDSALLFFGSHRDAMAFAPRGEIGVGEGVVPFNSAQRKPHAEMVSGDQSLNSALVAEVYHAKVPWRGVRVISIDEVDYNLPVWNLAVLDDESFVANGLIVHNCRSVLIPVTAIDGWDGTESEEPSIEPQAGFFTRCSHAEHFHTPGGHEHDQKDHAGTGGGSDDRVARAFSAMPETTHAGGKGAKAWRAAHEQQYKTDPEFRATADAVVYYTQGLYEPIREQSAIAAGGELQPQYKGSWYERNADEVMTPGMYILQPYFSGQARAVEGKGSTTYAEAGRAINAAIEASAPTTTPIYRGLYGQPAHEAVAGLKPGDEFTVRGATSFTRSKEIGEKFASGIGNERGITARDVKGYKTLIEIAPGARALNVSALSPWKQSESLTRGTFRVKSVKVTGDRWAIGGALAHVVVERTDS